MIYLKVPAVFTNKYLEKLNELNVKQDKVQISEVYGNLPFSGLGSTRTPDHIPNVCFQDLSDYTKTAKKYNIKFNYIINTTCVGSITVSELNKVLHEEIKKLLELEIYFVTVSIPYIIEFIKEHYPQINIVASINMSLSSVYQLKHIQKLGATSVVTERSINRNIDLLKEMTKVMPIELLLNSMCLPFCLLYNFHNNVNSHYTENNKLIDYPFIECYSRYIKDTTQMICSAWIRPEDLEKYNKIGVNHFKVEGRGVASEVLLEIIEAYVNLHYTGSVFDLSFTGRRNRKSLGIYLDNSILDPFIDYFFKNSIDCRKCGGSDKFCKSIAEKIIINFDAKEKFIKESYNKKKEIQYLT